MEATDRELEIAENYLRGEYTEVQFNYLVHQCGSTKERMDSILEEVSTRTPIVNAAKFLLVCIAIHFLICTAYSLATFYRDI